MEEMRRKCHGAMERKLDPAIPQGNWNSGSVSAPILKSATGTEDGGGS
jgi:hypothetical protein